jgi:hypothetical protein
MTPAELRKAIEADGVPIASCLGRKMAPTVRVAKTDKPVTRDCYAAHMRSWCGGATPKRPAAE